MSSGQWDAETISPQSHREHGDKRTALDRIYRIYRIDRIDREHEEVIHGLRDTLKPCKEAQGGAKVCKMGGAKLNPSSLFEAGSARRELLVPPHRFSW